MLKGDEWKKEKVTVVQPKGSRDDDPFASLAKGKKKGNNVLIILKCSKNNQTHKSNRLKRNHNNSYLSMDYLR